MSLIKKLLRKKLFWAGILIPVIFHLVFLLIVIPALKDGNTNITNLKVGIVNDDRVTGSAIAGVLKEKLPFKTEISVDISGTLQDMEDGKYNMVIYIPADFTTSYQKGEAKISYYIDQNAPSMTRQVMESTADEINGVINESSFNTAKETVGNKLAGSVSASSLPEETKNLLKNNLSQALSSLKYNSITSDIKKVNNADGFIQSFLPFLLFLIYFVGSVMISVVHYQVFKPLERELTRWKIGVSRQIVNIVAALIVPCAAVALISAFNIPVSTSVTSVWLILAVGFLTFTLMLQMFSEWFGLAGMSVAAVILFPMQFVTTGLIFSREILPGFYEAIRNIFPSTYFGSGMLKVFYGGSIAYEVGIMLVISAICILLIYSHFLMKKTKAIAQAE